MPPASSWSALVPATLAAALLSCGGGRGSPSGGAGGASAGPVGTGTSSSAGAGGSTPPPQTCPAPIQPADVSSPTTVVGTGTAASCTETALTAALAKGGVVTFDCGAAPVPVTVSAQQEITVDTVIDGGGT